MNPDKHGLQFPQFSALLDAASAGDKMKSCEEEDCMAVDIRRMRQGVGRRRRVGVAVLGDSEIIGISRALILN